MPHQNGVIGSRHSSQCMKSDSAIIRVIVGSQWGDEGKGKLVDLLSENADVVCRCQGGNNAGHTVSRNNTEYFFHMLPSGLIRGSSLGVIGNGTVVNIPGLFKEIDDAVNRGLKNIENRIRISDKCHLVLTLHQLIDKLEEDIRGAASLGTTKKGIGPAYSSKVTRNGLRMCDLVGDWSRFVEKYTNLFQYAKRRYPLIDMDIENDLETLRLYRQRLIPMVCDTVTLLNKMAGDATHSILIEGAQSCMLDVDFGTYPHVTSSNCTVGGVCTGLGIPPSKITDVFGVLKAYTTRVGSGPFPTELHDHIGDHLQRVGKEWGVTTKRRRRVGWLDTVIVRYANMINGFTALALTKLDVLDELKEIRIGYAYVHPDTGEELPSVPADSDLLNRVKVLYKTLPGWNASTKDCVKFEDLPEAAQQYVLEVECLCGVPIRWIGTGAACESIIVREV